MYKKKQKKKLRTFVLGCEYARSENKIAYPNSRSSALLERTEDAYPRVVYQTDFLVVSKAQRRVRSLIKKKTRYTYFLL